jgi:hypothetical protein
MAGFGIEHALEQVDAIATLLYIDPEECITDSDEEVSVASEDSFDDDKEEDESPPESDHEDTMSTDSFELGTVPYKTRKRTLYMHVYCQ